MALQTEYPHIEQLPGEPPRLRRMPRIRVAQIAMGYLAHGWSADEMCRQYPHLLPAEIHAAMAFYFDFQSDLDDEIRAELEEMESQQQPVARSPFYLRMKARGLM